MIIHGLQKMTLVDYPGKVAAILFTGACNFRCPFCQNASLVLDPSSEPEIPEETRYEVGFFLPFELFEKIQHAPIPVSGTVWRGNVYKCGDQTSHPHWASWRPVRRVNFHEPDCFDILEFE